MIQHRTIEVNGITLHIAEAGAEGPLVVLLHGFPESWHSWRHQFAPLVAAGFRVVAPDQRGYGASDRPDDVAAYSVLHLVGDVVGLIHALGEETAFVVGHDWGAPVAWHTALLRPDVVRGVAGLSVAPTPRGANPPLEVVKAAYDGRFYWTYFNQVGVADEEFGRDPKTSLRRFVYAFSGDAPGEPGIHQALIEPGTPWLVQLPAPEQLPDWFTESDLDELAEGYVKGFTGGLNWYRNLDRNWELTAPFAGASITTPALFVYGDRDPVAYFPGTPELVARLPELVPGLRRPPVVLPGCGHWTQQERPAEVNELLVEFLTGLRDEQA
ncbi:epoxide hydrolase [Streptomyces sp. V2]|uniref:Alpha/beta fold hydrolase n=1 Tax=Streptomyces niveiscabiei TaxID=164115 RepID=A0ABW9HL10_9ACTN|nr:alpha/beta hydrolase [Streptomyces sp. V2]PWG13030.1 epoxide hydrolase [Streptomyces sp. V2]